MADEGVREERAFAEKLDHLFKTVRDSDQKEYSHEDVAQAIHVSAYSLVSLTMACKPILNNPASVVGLTFDARVSWPTYDWMGVAKAALESTSRYLARYVGADGIRSNIVAAGPLDTIAKKAIPGANTFNDIWGDRAPLGWDDHAATPTAKLFPSCVG